MNEQQPEQLSFPEAPIEPANEAVVDPALVPVQEPEGQKGLPSTPQARAGLTDEQLDIQSDRNKAGVAEAVAALDRINQREAKK